MISTRLIGKIAAVKRTIFSAIISLLSAAIAPAATVEVQYELGAGSASIDPFTIPNPNGGEDFTVSPSLTIDSGSFTAIFPSDEFGTVIDGAAQVRDFQFIGSVDIEVSTIITIIFPLNVAANLTGPLSGIQVSDSSGILVGGSTYGETSPGNYNTTAGPLDCSDNAFGAVCGGIETALGIDFPLPQVAGDEAPIPFTGGTFSGLNGSAPSTAGNTLELAVPIDDTTNFSFAANFTWDESSRTLVIPEPSATALLLSALSLGALFRRRR